VRVVQAGKWYEKLKCRKYDTKYQPFGFTDIDVGGEEKPLCLLCMKILAVESIKLNIERIVLLDFIHRLVSQKIEE
jgi:hypothetical protein